MSSPNIATDFDALLVDFGHALRAAGLPVGTDDVLTFCEGTSHLDVTDLMDVYWSGRTTLVRRREHVPIYNLVFRMFFFDVDPTRPDERKRMMRASANAGATLEIPNTEAGLPGDVSPDEAKLGYVASTSEV